jgi:hypothetical protein
VRTVAATRFVVPPGRSAVDPPEARGLGRVSWITSHLLLLEAVAGARLVGRAYAAALDRGYLWHEFGDACLLLAE